MIQSRPEAERLVLQTVSDVLEVADVSLDDDFFAIGGESTDAIRVLVRLQRLTGTRLKVDEFFAAPTPSTLVDLVWKSLHA
ncbi:phosphopantetheine-binding protein [Micromonospora sp. WMMA1976]|uniref:phosphopantetheine-binding protein n=1 Tax=Micromonospora sp. WMMA1976 TaxID=3014995 RepID=UPI00248C60E5|nr:phosphopantetheine-binding protein [Micromonospora sp. WMMA1976]WBC01104.1 phosphopantetheine-binding protein [Micromonospora sp. WMMA1976]